MKRDFWLEVLSTDAEQRRWVRASGADWKQWSDGNDPATERFQGWVRRVLNAAARSGKKR